MSHFPRFKKLFSLAAATTCLLAVHAADEPFDDVVAWRLDPPLESRIPVDVDSLVFNYGQRSVPSCQSAAYVTTGNLGAEGETLLYFKRKSYSDFFFADSKRAWIPSAESQLFFNSRIPITQLSYNFGGGKPNGQDRLHTIFSGNITAKAQVGALLDYLHSKGSYANQAAKNLTWGFSGSYTGDRYQFQGFFYHYNSVNLENGGIINDLYITDPAEVQGGITSVDAKNIPTRLNKASSRIKGTQLLLNNKYNLGFTSEQHLDDDSIVSTFTPVTTIGWTLDYKANAHEFHNSNSAEGHDFWTNFYLNNNDTRDHTSYWNLRNTLSISLLEGFNKWAKAGLTAFATYEYRHFTLMPDSLLNQIDNQLTPLPFNSYVSKASENLFWVGGQLTRGRGRVLNYDATAQFGLLGEATGEVLINGNIDTNIPIKSDSLNVVAFGSFSNVNVPYLLRHYLSNHFAWDNDFSKTRKLKFGGTLNLSKTLSCISVGVENIQNAVYFNQLSLPQQCDDNVQVFSATLNQKLAFKSIHWDNQITYQTSSNQSVIPLPKLAIYSNLYLYFRIAKVLQVQLGVDCNYYTRYKALAYQPATMTFYNQDDVKLGNYPFMNLYMNMKLKRTRFYLMMSHINQGWFGNDYFSLPNYPLNPRRFQLGVSIDFLN